MKYSEVIIVLLLIKCDLISVCECNDREVELDETCTVEATIESLIPVIGGRRYYGSGTKYCKGRRRRYGYAPSLFSLHPALGHVGSEARKINLYPTLMLHNARSINKKTATLQNYFATENPRK